MRAAIVLAALLAVAATRGECGAGEPWDPCAGKACDEGCTLCPPGATDCVETAEVKACDPSGRCVPRVDGLCAPSWGCEGKACGDPCGYCPPETDPADCPVPTFAPTACDARLQCVNEGSFTCPTYDPCAGKACGESCSACPPPPEGEGCFETAVVKECDAAGRCDAAPATCD